MNSSFPKRTKVGWVEVEEHYFVITKPKNNISRNDNGDSNAKDISGITDGYHSFIQDKIFHGEICLKQDGDVRLNDHIKESIIAINPQTMEICGFQIGYPVIVRRSSKSNRLILNSYRSWPSNKIPLGKVGMSKHQLSLINIEMGESICVEVGNKPIFANLVQLRPLCIHEEVISFQASAHFNKYIATVLENVFVMIDQQVSVLYFGKPFLFKIVQIETKKQLDSEYSTTTNGTFAIEKDTLPQVSDKLGSLDLSLSENDFDICSLTSTPLRNNSTKSCNENASYGDRKNSYSDRNNLVYVLSDKTKYEIIFDQQTAGHKPDNTENPRYSFNSVGGIRNQIQTIKDLIVMPLQNPHLFIKSGIQPIHGIILHGLPGTGKSLLAEAVASEANTSLILIQVSEILSRFLGESEKQLNKLFCKAKQKSPCIVIMDEIDALCPKRENSRTDAERRLVASLVNILDNLNKTRDNSHVVVIATTNRLDSVDPALRRAGRFDREIEIPVPDASDRAEILAKLLTKYVHKVSANDVERLAMSAHGYVGADLAAVCVEAGMNSVKRYTSGQNQSEIAQLIPQDIEAGLKLISPSAMRELIVQVPKVYWSDIGGNESVKKKLKQAIEWPLKNPAAFARLGIDPPRGLLMYGPPGCSKTLTAKALATESGLNFISIKGPELFSKFVGDSERSIRRIFSKARSAAPSIIFFDELDALAIERGSGNAVADRVLAAMLTEMDGVEQRSDVIVVAATNRPDMIDKALMRPGRIDRILHVPLPDVMTRREIFRIRFQKMPIACDVSIDELVHATDMYSGAEICSVCREAALEALVDDQEASLVCKRHFVKAISLVHPQTTSERARMYEEYGRTLQTRIK